MTATITTVDRFGFFCRGIQIPAEGLVHISTLSANDYFEYDPPTMSLISRRKGTTYRLGDRVIVEVAKVDVNRRELNFKLIGIDRSSSRRSGPPAHPVGKTRPSKEKKGKTKAKGKRGSKGKKRR